MCNFQILIFFYNYLIGQWPFGVTLLSGCKKYFSVLSVKFLPLLVFFSKSTVMTDTNLLLNRHVLFRREPFCNSVSHLA